MDSSHDKALASISREIGETKVALKGIHSRLDEHINLTVKELKAINELDNEQNRILDVHIAGVNNLRDMYVAHRQETNQQIQLLKQMVNKNNELSQARLDKLEQTETLLKYIGKVFIWVVMTSGAALIAAFVKGWI